MKELKLAEAPPSDEQELWEEPWMNDLEICEGLLDAAYRWHVFAPEFYENGGCERLEEAYCRAMYGDPED